MAGWLTSFTYSGTDVTHEAMATPLKNLPRSRKAKFGPATKDIDEAMKIMFVSNKAIFLPR